MAIGFSGSPGFSFQWLGSQVTGFVDRLVEQKLRASGAEWLAISRSLAPVDTGRLRAEEDFRVIGKTLTLIMGTPYDIFQEFGTRYIRPHPHVRPALNAIGRIWGTTIEMEFAAPQIARPIFAHKGGFVVPQELTPKQRHHVVTHLLPTSRRLHRGNVKRAKFRVRRTP